MAATTFQTVKGMVLFFSKPRITSAACFSASRTDFHFFNSSHHFNEINILEGVEEGLMLGHVYPILTGPLVFKEHFNASEPFTSPS